MVRKAIIPIAGKATRLMPVTSVMPKAMLPLVDHAGRIMCVIDVICREAVEAGVEQIALVVSPDQRPIISTYFAAARECGVGGPLAEIRLISQPEPDGFGDAVLCAEDFIDDEPFLLMLGDHIHVEKQDPKPCTVQVVEAFDPVEAVTTIGVQTVGVEDLARVGVATGDFVGERTYRCTRFVEKPDIATARAGLVTDGLPERKFLAHCGIYVLGPEIFPCLSQARESARQADAETELADAQAILLDKHPGRYLLRQISGRAYDVGTPEGYARAQAAFRER